MATIREQLEQIFGITPSEDTPCMQGDEDAAEFETVHPDTAMPDNKKIREFVQEFMRAFSPHGMTDDEIDQQRISMDQNPNNPRSYTLTGFDADVYFQIVEDLCIAPKGTSFHDVVNNTLRKGLGMDQLKQLKRENEKLAVDSVVLNEIINAVSDWDHDLERNPDIRLDVIAKIIEER